VRPARLAQLLTLGDPRDPGRLRQARVLRRHPHRCCIVVASRRRPRSCASAAARRRRRRRAHRRASRLRRAAGGARARARGAPAPRRALQGAALSSSRRSSRARPSAAASRRLARRLGRDEASVTRDARRYLREIAAQHSPHHIDLAANLIRFMYTQGYGETLHYDRAQLEALAALGQRHPLVFLPTHKSMLDSLVLKYALYENGLPPNHTAGGINMNFFPMARSCAGRASSSSGGADN